MGKDKEDNQEKLSLLDKLKNLYNNERSAAPLENQLADLAALEIEIKNCTSINDVRNLMKSTVIRNAKKAGLEVSSVINAAESKINEINAESRLIQPIDLRNSNTDTSLKADLAVYFNSDEFKQADNTLKNLASGKEVTDEDLTKTANIITKDSDQKLCAKFIKALEKEKEDLAKRAIVENRELTADEKAKFIGNNRELAVLYNRANCAKLVNKIIEKCSPSKKHEEAILENLHAIKSVITEYSMSKEAIETEVFLNKEADKLFNHISKSAQKKEKDILKADSMFSKIKEEVKQEDVLDGLVTKHIALAKEESETTNDTIRDLLKGKQDADRKIKQSSNIAILAALENKPNKTNNINNPTIVNKSPYFTPSITPKTNNNTNKGKSSTRTPLSR